MTNRGHNAKIFSQIRELALQFKQDGDSKHDSFFVAHIENTPKGEIPGQIKSVWRGCECNISPILKRLAKDHPEFNGYIFQAAQDLAVEKIKGSRGGKGLNGSSVTEPTKK